MCCEGSGNNCNCGCETLTLPSITGPAGPTGPAGISVLYWNTSTLSTPTTGADVLLDTYVLSANELTTAGDALEIEITGNFLLTSTIPISRYLKIELNNPITSIVQCLGNPANGQFVSKITITMVSNTSTEGFAFTTWNNGTTTNLSMSYPFVTDFTSNQNIKFYVNQNTASALRVDSIKIKKAIL